MKRTPRAFVQFFTYEAPYFAPAVLQAPQLVQSEAGLLGSLAAADRPPTPPELKVPNWGSNVAQSLGNLASVPRQLQQYQAGQIGIEKAQAELPAEKEAARTEYMKQVEVNQKYINDISKNNPDLLKYIINSKDTGLGPFPIPQGGGLNATGQNPIIPTPSFEPGTQNNPNADPRFHTAPTNTTNTPAQVTPKATPTAPPTPTTGDQSSTDVPVNDPRMTSALIAARGGPMMVQAGEEGSKSTDTGASPAAAEVKQSTAIPAPPPPNGDDVAKAYGSQIAPVSGWHREVNPDGSLGRFVMQHKDKDLADQPVHDAWLPKLGLNTSQANPQIAGQLGSADLAAAAPMASTPENNNAIQGPDGMGVLPMPASGAVPAMPGSVIPQVPGTADQMSTMPPAFQRNGNSGTIQIGAKPGTTPSGAPNASSPVVTGETPMPIPPEGPNQGDSIWQKNYEGMNRDDIGKLANDPKKVVWTGNYTTNLGGQNDQEGTVPGVGVNANKRYPVWKDPAGLLYAKVGDTGYSHWRYYLNPDIHPVQVEDQIGKDAMMKMQAKVIDMGTGDAGFPNLSRNDQISSYNAAVALDNARKDRNPEYDSKVDAAEKVVDATTDLQMELDKLKTPQDPSGMFARSLIRQGANELARTWGTSVPPDWAQKITDWTSHLPGGAVDPYHPPLNSALQKYQILLDAARGASQRLQSVSEKIPANTSHAQTDVASIGRFGDPDLDDQLATYAKTAKSDLDALIRHGVANNYNIPQQALLKANAYLSPTSIGNDSQNCYKLIDPDNAKNAERKHTIAQGAWIQNSLGDKMRNGMPNTFIKGNHP